MFRHLVLGEILACETAAIDGGGEGVAHALLVEFQLFHARDERLVNLMIFLDGVEVNHFGGVAFVVELIWGLCFVLEEELVGCGIDGDDKSTVSEEGIG